MDKKNLQVNEGIKINGKILQYGVLSDEEGLSYQVYLYPSMTVNEIAFNMAVTMKLLLKDGHIKSKKKFVRLIDNYFTDPQYAELEQKEQTDEAN